MIAESIYKRPTPNSIREALELREAINTEMSDIQSQLAIRADEFRLHTLQRGPFQAELGDKVEEDYLEWRIKARYVLRVKRQESDLLGGLDREVQR